jgi:hypothetical protein
MFFRRFYLRHSIINYDPRIMMLTCMFLAGKIEDQFISIEKDLLRISNKFTMNQILASELDLFEVLYTPSLYPSQPFNLFLSCQGIHFDLKIHHPQTCVHGLLGDWKKWIRTNPMDLHPHPLSHHHTNQSIHHTIPRHHLPTDQVGKVILPSHAPGHYRSPAQTLHYESHQKHSKDDLSLLVAQWQHRCEAILILLQVYHPLFSCS